jgi:hypothetical protein
MFIVLAYPLVRASPHDSHLEEDQSHSLTTRGARPYVQNPSRSNSSLDGWDTERRDHESNGGIPLPAARVPPRQAIPL